MSNLLYLPKNKFNLIASRMKREPSWSTINQGFCTLEEYMFVAGSVYKKKGGMLV